MKKLKGILISGFLTVLMAMPVYAAEWKQEGSIWKYQNDDGSFAAGWNWIGGKCYYFDASGNMLSNTTTPDGYQVNENGEWIVDGVVQTQGGNTGNTSSRQFGSRPDSETKGYWSDKNNLTWTWWDGSGSVVIGNGPKYSDLHPEVTDREYLLKEYVNYPGEGMTNLNSWGEPKANIDERALQLLREFVNSFDWINSDELTRAQAVYERIALGRHGNRYGSSYASKGAWVVLQYNEGVCADYAREFKWLATYVGLECEAYEPSAIHAANLVRINGQWITIDAQLGTSFFDNGVTVPVDFATEYNRVEEEYKQSDAQKRWEQERELEEKYWNGEITYEELQKLGSEIYK